MVIVQWIPAQEDASDRVGIAAATTSGKPYVGRSTDWDSRQTFSGDGRDRSMGEIIGRYPSQADDTIGQSMEQQAINDRGGIDNLDNKINAQADDSDDDD